MMEQNREESLFTYIAYAENMDKERILIHSELLERVINCLFIQAVDLFPVGILPKVPVTSRSSCEKYCSTILCIIFLPKQAYLLSIVCIFYCHRIIDGNLLLAVLCSDCFDRKSIEPTVAVSGRHRCCWRGRLQLLRGYRWRRLCRPDRRRGVRDR